MALTISGITIPMVAVSSVDKFTENHSWKKLERWQSQPAWQKVSTAEAKWGIDLWLHSDLLGADIPDSILTSLREIEQRGEIVPVSYSGIIEGQEKEILNGWFWLELSTQNSRRTKAFSVISVKVSLTGSTSLNYQQQDQEEINFDSPWSRVQNSLP